jgi:isoleucyl-tRNA synthetase
VLLETMKTVQEICSLGLKVRADTAIKLRQPLASATINLQTEIPLSQSLLEIIQSELNVKEVIIGLKSAELAVNLDTSLTPELMDEGIYREVARQIQAARKNAGLNFGELVTMQFFTEDETLKAFVEKKKPELMKELYLSEILTLTEKQEELAIGKVDGVKIGLGFGK